MVFDKDKGTSNISLLKTPTSLYVFLDSETFLNRVISVIVYILLNDCNIIWDNIEVKGQIVKYILIIWVCSFIPGNACLTSIEYPTMYNSWYECSRDAHVESIKLMSKMGYKYVNDYKVGTKYRCKAIPTY